MKKTVEEQAEKKRERKAIGEICMKNPMKKKKWMVMLVVLAISMACMGCGEKYGYVGNGGYHKGSHKCEECSNTETKRFLTPTGEYMYYCRRHSETCCFCRSRPSTRYYMNLLEMLMFACDRCYARIRGDE